MKLARYCNLFCYYECFVILAFTVGRVLDDLALTIEKRHLMRFLLLCVFVFECHCLKLAGVQFCVFLRYTYRNLSNLYFLPFKGRSVNFHFYM